jgi:hypothetical protein
MADHDGELTEELLNSLLPPDFSNLSKAEQIALGKSLLRRLETALEEHRKNPDGGARSKLSRKSFSPDLPVFIGEVVIAAAWAEDAAGTLIQASSGGWEVRAKGYDDTSSSLVKALKRLDAIVPAELIERLENALKLRHFVVHGFFTDGSFVKHPETGKTYDFVSMKRSWRTDAPEREMKAFTKNALKWLAQEFWGIEAELEDLHSKVLFNENEDNEAPSD